MAATSTTLLKVLLGAILLISFVDAIALGNREPWNLWSYGGRELKKRSTEVEKELTELEVRGKKKNKPLLSIQTQDGGMIYATNTRRVDVTDAVALDVLCGRWEVCSKMADGENSCIDIDSICPCRKEGTTMQPTPINKVKLLKRRDCD